jgi:hypothetical protein
MAEASIQELREVNRLVYLKPDNGALIDKRTMKSYNFSTTSNSPGQTPQCIINSGGDAVYGMTSYLRFEYTKDAGTIGTGSVLNFIKSVRLTHRSGEVLERIDNYNVLGKLLSKYGVDVDGGAKITSMLKVPDAANDMATPSYLAIIPMWMLLGVFGEQAAYIPPGFLAGAKLEIELESNAIAFATAGVLSDVKLTVVLDSAQVYDSVTKQLLDEQADVSKSGLQFSYSTWFNAPGLFATGRVNFDVQQSASITQVACAVLRDEDKNQAAADSFLFKPAFTTVQWRLGSQYFPQQALQLAAGAGIEAYTTTLVAWDGAPKQYEGMSASGKGVAADFPSWSADTANYAQTMEKSSTGLQLTGEPTNNSRILNLEASKPVDNDRVDIFLKYLRVANIMGDNVVVDR